MSHTTNWIIAIATSLASIPVIVHFTMRVIDWYLDIKVYDYIHLNESKKYKQLKEEILNSGLKHNSADNELIIFHRPAITPAEKLMYRMVEIEHTGEKLSIVSLKKYAKLKE